MLRDGTFYQDLGADHFRRISPEVQANRLARQIAKLGFTCTISPAAEREVLFRSCYRGRRQGYGRHGRAWALPAAHASAQATTSGRAILTSYFPGEPPRRLSLP